MVFLRGLRLSLSCNHAMVMLVGEDVLGDVAECEHAQSLRETALS